MSRTQLATLAGATGSAMLVSDLWWDEVASIEYAGDVETYDLTVPGDHNFVADDIVVHNSALMANFAENAALESKKAVALFSLEMSESELAQRFIASQASIRGDDLRKGKVRLRAGRRSCRLRTVSRSRRSTSTTRPTSQCWTCARRRAGSRSRTPTGSD